MTFKSPTRFMGSASGWATLAAVLLLAGCGKGAENATNVTNSLTNVATVEAIEDPDALRANDNVVGAPLPTDAWVGRWAGPEGLFLDIQPSPDGQPGHYAITNKDTLDRQADYQGVGEGTTIRFVREGKDRAIRTGSGKDTGFKYLADKTDCLIVIPNQEGYCR